MAQSHVKDMPLQAPAMGVFFSPPEQQRSNSFSSPSPAALKTTFAGNDKERLRLPSLASLFPPLSPPISPHAIADKDYTRRPSSSHAQDPLLFPDRQQSPRASNAQSLFSIDDQQQRDLIDQHIRDRRTALPQLPLPAVDEYELAAAFVHKIVGRYNSDPAGYISKELGYLKQYTPLQRLERAVPHVDVMKMHPTPRRQSRVKTTSGVAKIATPHKRVHRLPPKETTLDIAQFRDFTADASPAREMTHAARVTPHRDDTDFAALPDFCPPLSSISSSSKALKTEWRGHPLDLSNDPDRHMLHDAEITLASTLRLSCAQYLCSKRRIFASRLESLRNNREFRKTTAQQACKIDVNKASKLWTAFDKVGWFDTKYMVPYLKA